MNFNKQYLIHGFLPAFFSACFFAVMVTCIKATSSELPTIQLVFLRSIIGLIIIIPFEGGYHLLRTKQLNLHLLRGAFVVLATILFFLGLAEIPLSEATAIFFVSLLQEI